MWLLFAASFFVTAACLSVSLKERICDTIAVTMAMTILILYVLAFFGGLKLVYPISVLGAIGLFYVTFIRSDNRKTEIIKVLSEPSVFCFILTAVVLVLCTKDTLFTWWDDINFWSSDAKQIFYMNGFPGKYGNVSPEFGDYPPVTSLAKWIFLQFSPSEYLEGLQFAGYHVLNLSFLMPLVGAFVRGMGDRLSPAKKIVGTIATELLVFLIPGIVNGIIFYGTPADITMGIVYGALLLAMWDRDVHSTLFYYGRIALFAAVLLLTKSVGIEWAAFALVFWFCLIGKRGGIGREGKCVLMSVLTAALFYGSWLGFCLINRRVAKATGLGIKMATGSYAAPANFMDKAKFFFLGLWTMPMHADHNITFDIPIGAVLILIFAALVVMLRAGIFRREEKAVVALFLIVSCVLSYGIIFIAHVSIFQAEDQYLDAFAMTNSVARYGAPFTIGGIYLLLGAMLCALGQVEKKTSCMLMAGAALFIVLTADYTGTLYMLSGYRADLPVKAAYNEDMLDDGGMRFIEAVYGHRELWGKRVLNIRGGSFNHWVHDTYISKEVSPVPVVYETLTESDDGASLSQKIKASHASFLYVEAPENTSGVDAQKALSEFSLLMADGESFEFDRIYAVRGSDNVVLSVVNLY